METAKGKKVTDQIQLPKPPVPDLAQTLKLYLEYARVIAPDQNLYAKTKGYVEEFGKQDGLVLQDELCAMADKSDNWINEFWLADMYLKNRVPLPIFSNPGYVFPDQKFGSEEEMIRYASYFISGVYRYKEKLDRRELPVDKSTGKDGGQPLCMEQYWHLFTSYRLSSSPVDKLDTATNRNLGSSEHVVVLCNNQFFQIDTVINGELISQAELNKQLADVVEMAQNQPADVVPLIGLITAVNRDHAAFASNLLEQDRINIANVEAIKSASFLICFDKPSLIENGNSNTLESHLATRAVHMLHGQGVAGNTANRWFSKTMQFIFSRDGACGLNYEHSVAEAVVIINLVEESIRYADSKIQHKSIGSPRLNLKPKALTWNVSPELQSVLDACKDEADRLVKDLDFVILDYHGYGKEFPKSKRLSPDAFIQVTLQLTYFRCHGRLVSTYESATTRRFRHGRVDNIRAATPEALAWVKVMDDEHVSEDEKRAAFRKAIEKQTSIMIQNISGHGIDNHLIGLHDLAKKRLPAIPHLFNDPMFTELFRFPLSTSQVSTTLPNTLICYGPVVDDGYGCSYNIRDGQITFIVSSLKSSPKTDSTRFRKTLEKTLNNMKDFLR